MPNKLFTYILYGYILIFIVLLLPALLGLDPSSFIFSLAVWIGVIISLIMLVAIFIVVRNDL